MSAMVTLMIFINPKTDFAFKKIFGSEQSKGILMSFLNGILYAGDAVIQDLTILDPYQAPKILGIKSSYLDVKAKLSNGSWVIIEMQVLNVEGFEKRVLYNATKTYSAQLSKGDQYDVLNPVIALTITDFKMFDNIDDLKSVVDDRPISRFVLKEEESSVKYPTSDLELVFVELPKFKVSLADLETLTDKWIYFLQNAKDLSVVPDNMGAVAEIRQAFDIANQAGLTRDELDLVERQLMYIQDQRGALTYATRVSKEEGREEGRKEGREEGGKDMQRSIAQKLLPTLDDVTISQTTGLSLEEVRSLRTEI
jgi:predicted transposase/invertase (TIGR01784 family)